MASAVKLRDDFTAARMRALARSSPDASQVRRLLALVTVYEGGTRSELAQLGGVGLRRFAIGCCGSTPLVLMG